MSGLSSAPVGETETRMFQISGVSLHSILADILNTMERPLYKNFFRLRLVHRCVIHLRIHTDNLHLQILMPTQPIK